MSGVEYRVLLKRNEYTGREPGSPLWVMSFPTRNEALSYVRNSGYVMELGNWMQGKAKWQMCYSIERTEVAA